MNPKVQAKLAILRKQAQGNLAMKGLGNKPAPSLPAAPAIPKMPVSPKVPVMAPQQPAMNYPNYPRISKPYKY